MVFEDIWVENYGYMLFLIQNFDIKYILKVKLIDFFLKKRIFMVHKFCFGLKPIIISGLIENLEDIMMLVIFMMNGTILGYLILDIMESNNI